jgi:excinuclease UvrABC ATPase subunit
VTGLDKSLDKRPLHVDQADRAHAEDPEIAATYTGVFDKIRTSVR